MDSQLNHDKVAMVHQNSSTVEFQWEHSSGKMRWDQTELSVHSRTTNTEPSIHFRKVLGNPLEEPCQPLDNTIHPSSFTQINPILYIFS